MRKKFIQDCNDNGFEAYSFSRDVVVINKENGKRLQIPAKTIDNSSLEHLHRIVKRNTL